MHDKVVVVTGGAKGIGNCIVEKFASEGAKVIILDFDEEAGNKSLIDLRKKGYEIDFINTDISNFESLKYARSIIIEKYGGVDILVINAGITKKNIIENIDIEEWNQVINTNLNGSFYTIKAFFNDFKNKTIADQGKIIFITSGSAITGTGGGAHYASSKSGQHGLMRALSKELGSNGVNVNAIAPRVIETDLFKQLYKTEEEKENLMSKIPIGRFGVPKDIANLAYFLAREESSYIHGQVVLIDGGRTY